MVKVFIYRIYFPTSNKSYIGQTKDLKRRIKQHLKSDSNSFVGNALRKYNDWIITILHVIDYEWAATLEVAEIAWYNSTAPNGYNLSRGGVSGSNGYKWTREQRERIQGRKGYWEDKKRPAQSKRMQGNKIGIGNRGISGQKRLKESIEKQIKTNTGAKRSLRAKRNILMGRLKPETEIKRLKTMIKNLEAKRPIPKTKIERFKTRLEIRLKNLKERIQDETKT